MPAPSEDPDWQQIHECYRVLKKAGSNLVWEILRQSEPFTQWKHYPKGDVIDRETQSQYFYHAHPPSNPDTTAPFEENGHFHLFIRKPGIPATIQLVEVSKACRPENSKDDEVCHLISISMDKHGYPNRFFTTNRWVTGESWYQASDVITLLDYFNLDHSYPSWPLNLWISSMVRVYRNEISKLIFERDQVIDAWQQKHPDKNVYEDRNLEITSQYVLPENSLARANSADTNTAMQDLIQK